MGKTVRNEDGNVRDLALFDAGIHFTRVGSTVRSCDRPPLAPQGVQPSKASRRFGGVMVHSNQSKPKSRFVPLAFPPPSPQHCGEPRE
jgi:hypothetical protein